MKKHVLIGRVLIITMSVFLTIVAVRLTGRKPKGPPQWVKEACKTWNYPGFVWGNKGAKKAEGFGSDWNTMPDPEKFDVYLCMRPDGTLELFEPAPVESSPKKDKQIAEGTRSGQ